MPILILFALLASFSVEAQTVSNTKFVLLPASVCLEPHSREVEAICRTKSFSGDVSLLKLVPSTTDRNVFASFERGAESDDMELLCYRCSLKKKQKSDCGRYSQIWGQEKWASKCPESP